jgi:hypothetical protein
MKTRTSLIAATLATLIAGSALANTQASDATTSMTVDAGAPIQATLLPTVTLEASSANSAVTMRVADTAPVMVTLLPTVHVTARAQNQLAVTLLPTVRVTPASAATIDGDVIADAEDIASNLPVIDDASPNGERPLGLRARTMPR